jgi:hypothetical protein
MSWVSVPAREPGYGLAGCGCGSTASHPSETHTHGPGLAGFSGPPEPRVVQVCEENKLGEMIKNARDEFNTRLRRHRGWRVTHWQTSARRRPPSPSPQMRARVGFLSNVQPPTPSPRPSLTAHSHPRPKCECVWVSIRTSHHRRPLSPLTLTLAPNASACGFSFKFPAADALNASMPPRYILFLSRSC